MSTGFVRVFIATTICAAAICSPQRVCTAESPSVSYFDTRDSINFEYRFRPAELVTNQGVRRVYKNLIHQAERACTTGHSSMTDLHNLDRRCGMELVDAALVARVGRE